MREARPLRLLGVLLCALGCTNDQVVDLGAQGVAPIDRQIQLQGKFCALGPNQVISPIKILFIMDGTGSMIRSDPKGTRATAIVQLIQSLPVDPNIYFAVMVFRGPDTYFLTKTGLPQFDQVISYSQTQLDNVVAQILLYSNTTPSGPNTSNTDFVKPIDAAYAMIDNDIAVSNVGSSDGGVQLAPARYVTIFLSDGSPTIPQDPAIITAITQFAGLNYVAESSTFNTVHISPVPNNTCYVTDAGFLQCSALIFQQDAERLANMAAVGLGQFRDFENQEPVNYLGFTIGNVRRSYVVKELYAANFSAPPDSPPDQADSDSDGLSDWLELDAGLNPYDPDTDHDGFSDGVEWYLKYKEHSPTYDPAVYNAGCSPDQYHVDTDCDGLWDCDEYLIGGNRRLIDTDGDGAPDGVEFRLGTQLTTRDLGADSDTDGVLNGVELRLHTDPQTPDANTLAELGYRYELAVDGPPDSSGIQCYDYTVSNLLLENTLDLGEGPGYNDLYLAFAMVPSDNPDAPTLMRQLRYHGARYPVKGIKSPANGVITFQTTDFHDGCLPTDPPTWDAVP